MVSRVTRVPLRRHPQPSVQISVRRLSLNRFSRRWIITVTAICMIALAVGVAPLLAPYNPVAINAADRAQAPSFAHLFGTDHFGRDLFSRVLVGAQPTLQVALGAVMIGALPGLILGLVAGTKRGIFDQIVTQISDAWIAVPGVMVALVMSAAFGRSLLILAIALGISSIPMFYRVLRAETMRVSAEPYVEAAISLGATHRGLLFRHIFPNVAPAFIALVTISLGRMLLATSALSFIGLGAPPPSSEWGSLLAEGRAYMDEHWWLIFFPGLTIALATYVVFLFGTALRDQC